MRGVQSRDAFRFAEQLKDLMDGLGFADRDLQPIPKICVLGRRGE
jgi:hypothetical protein